MVEDGARGFLRRRSRCLLRFPVGASPGLRRRRLRPGRYRWLVRRIGRIGGADCFSRVRSVRDVGRSAFIALFEVMVLFTISLKVEEKVRRRGYAPEWR